MILTCLYLTGCGREEVPYLDTTQTQEQTVETERTEQKETLKSDQTIQVYVCGEVAAPGVYQLKDGMRICDAVEAAGGLTKAASREYWNLAEKLSDGQMIYFPTEEEAKGAESIGRGSRCLCAGGIGRADRYQYGGCRAACDHSGNRRDTGGGNSCIPGEKLPVCESGRYHAGIRNQKHTF